MKSVFKYLKSYKLLAVLAPLMMIGEVAGDLFLPYFMSFIVNFGITGMDIHDPVSGSQIAQSIVVFFFGADYTAMQLIICFGVLMLVITVLGGFFGIACAYMAATAAQGMGKDLRVEAYRKVMSLSIQQTDSFTTGSLITRMTNDITMVVDFAEMLMRQFVRAVVFLLGGTIMLVGLKLSFGAILLCAVPALSIVLILVLKKAIPLYGIVQEKLDQVNSVVQENVSGARVVKAYVQEEYECERFGRANSSLKDVNYDVLKKMAVVSPVLTILLNAAIAAIIYIGGYNVQIQNAGMTTGAIMAAITYITQIFNSVMMATNLFQSVFRANASAKRINEVLETEPVILDGSGQAGTAANGTDHVIEFRDVSFHYPGTKGRPVLSHINLAVRRGETFAIIGATGTGKSSLVSLIPRFYDVGGGEVRIDGTPVKDYKVRDLRTKISYVMQKSELFSDTLEGNIRWGKKDAATEILTAAAEDAQALEFIRNQPEGMDTFVAEKGASLSGGQKQRMSIARALLRDSEILILDDATSALDLATETRLRSALKKRQNSGQARGRTTVVMIAQRIASVMEADRIAVLENDGTIQYCASHAKLLEISETYRDIYDSQMQSGALIPKGEMI